MLGDWHPPITTAGTFPITIRDATGASATANVTVASNVSTTSPDGATITALGATIFDATTPTPIVWTLQTSGSGLQVYRNGVLDTNTSFVSFCCCKSIRKPARPRRSVGGSTPVSAPILKPRSQAIRSPGTTTPVVTGITLSNASVAAGAPAGTVVGNILVSVSSGTFTGTFQPLTGTDAAKFTIVGSQLRTTQALSAASYSINISTLMNGGTFTSPAITITATASAGTVTDINLTNTTIAAGQASGTVVGNIVVTMSAGNFNGTLALSGAQASLFSIDAANRLVTASSLSAATDAITITATF